MDKVFELINPLKRKKEVSIREDEFFGLFNGVPYKKIHRNAEENYNIGNKSMEYLPSFRMEANEPSLCQKTPNEALYNEIIFLPITNKPTFKIEEFLEVESDVTTEDSFIKDFPRCQENFTDIYLYWEYEEDDIVFVQEFFHFQEIQKKPKNTKKEKKTPQPPKNQNKNPEIKDNGFDFNKIWMEHFNVFNLSNFDFKSIFDHLMRTLQEEQQKQIIKIS